MGEFQRRKVLIAAGLLFAVLAWAALTMFGETPAGPVGDRIAAIADAKTLAYATHGGAGWASEFVKAMLCNWMVTVGTILAFASRSTIGKITAMWLPITVFFAHGYEHSIVNMFLIPAGMLLGAHVSIGQWWLWNQIPVTLGNMLGGALFTGAALWYTFARKQSMAPQPAEAGSRVAVAAGD